MEDNGSCWKRFLLEEVLTGEGCYGEERFLMENKYFSERKMFLLETKCSWWRTKVPSCDVRPLCPQSTTTSVHAGAGVCMDGGFSRWNKGSRNNSPRPAPLSPHCSLKGFVLSSLNSPNSSSQLCCCKCTKCVFSSSSHHPRGSHSVNAQILIFFFFLFFMPS